MRLPAPPAWVLGLALVGALAQVAVWAYLNDYDERVRDLLADLREDGSAAGPTPATAAEAGDAATDTWEDGREETASTEETDAWGEDPDV